MKLSFGFSSETRRRRLEVTLAIVLSAAATVALSHFIQVDPSKLPSAAIVTPVSERLEMPSGRVGRRPPPKVDPALLDAIANADIAAMDRLYKPGMPLDETLYAGAATGNVAVVRWLLDRGADIHEGADSPNAPILRADEHPEIVALLLERGARMPSLTDAARAGAVNIVTDLLGKKADVEPASAPPLHAAIASQRAPLEKKTTIVAKLLEAGANPNREVIEEDAPPDRPITIAVKSCAPEVDEDDTRDANVAECLPIIELLMKHGAKASGFALMAALDLDEPVLDKLLVRTEPGATAIALAQTPFTPFERTLPQVKKLAAKGVDWGWHDGEEDEALPLVAAVERADRESVAHLIARGAPVNRHYKSGRCALGVAIEHLSGDEPEYARMVELLIAKGADVNLRLPDGRTPLHAAASAGSVRAIHALLAAGARVNELTLFETALDAAENAGQIPAARVINAAGGVRGRPPP